MQPPNREASTEHDIRIERVLLDTFGLSTKQAGPEFSIVELIDIVTYLLLFSDTDDAEVLRQGLPVAIDNFASSLLPLGLKLNLATLELHLQLRIQLVLARARVVGEILEDDNEDIMNDDEELALRFVDNGQEALWDEYQGKAAQIMATVRNHPKRCCLNVPIKLMLNFCCYQILSGEADIDDLLMEYPYETFLAAFLRHVKRVLTHLKRPTIRQASSTVASSPSKYHEHIARKRLKADQVRRQSAPPPQLSQMPPSPYQDLRGKIRQARKSSPVRRPPSAIFGGSSKSQSASTLQNLGHDDDDSDEEVENVLLTRSSAPLASEQEDGTEEGQIQEIEASAEEKVEVEDVSMMVEEEVTTETQVVETQVVETQVVQKNLLDRSALGVFLETQADSQVDTQMEGSQEPDVALQENGDETLTGASTQDAGYWGNGMESVGGREASMDAGPGEYADLGQDVDEGLNGMEEEEAEKDSQASQAIPGRSDAPSPSLANPQSFDDSLYDELQQEADETIETFNQIVGEEVDISQVPILREEAVTNTDASAAVEAQNLENVEAENVITPSDTGAEGEGESSLQESIAPAEESTPQVLPRRRGRPPKKKPKCVFFLYFGMSFSYTDF